MDRGTVLHDVLEQVVTRAVDDGWAPGPGQPWPEQALTVLTQAADERFDRAQAEGVTGFPLLWEYDKTAMRADLVEFLARDDVRRRDFGGLAPVAAEWVFDGVELPLGDGRTLRLRGRIDRIDRSAADMLLVTDYKTGKADPFRPIVEDPCDRGQRLQLPVYAIAACATFGDEATAVRSEYWFTTRRGGFERIGHTIDEAVLDRARLALRTAVDGIVGGVFIARAKGKSNVLYDCPGCDPDGLGEHGVAQAWSRKGRAPELAALRALLGEAVTQ
jgi:RecB family exonuclease